MSEVRENKVVGLFSEQANSISMITPAPIIKTVYAVFKCHLDLGFTDTQAGVLRQYYDHYFPQAMETASALREAGGAERYVWTVGSWLLWQYLEQATPAQRERIREAVQQGDLAWNALPFSWETEMVDRPLLEAALGLSAALDRQFGTKTTGAKMTDVPGHTRGLVGPLAQAGVTFLDVGVNPASTPPDVPPLFRWRDPDGAELIVMYHTDYGGTQTIPGSDLAVSINVKHDNAGVHSREEIQSIYADLRREFPWARVVAASLSDVAAALEQYRSALPVVTAEIGDTWIYGCASDPVKIAQFRELSRLRREWLADRTLTAGDPADTAFVSHLLLAPEHTWGCDIKNNLADWDVYAPAELKAARSKPNFQKVESTWAEKRANNQAAIRTLPPALATQASQRLSALAPTRPDIAGLTKIAPSEEIRTRHFALSLDPATGAICRLHERRTGREWASASHPLGLFSYQTFSDADYQRFLGQYLRIDDWWPPLDFGKPGLDKYPAESRLWQPVRQETFAGCSGEGHRIVTQLWMPDSGDAPLTAWPDSVTLELSLPDTDPCIYLTLQWFGKAANRLPEALWLSFQPVAPDLEGWQVEKSGHAIAPGNVAAKGGRSLHAAAQISYQDADGRLTLETLDAPLIAPGRQALLDFDDALPDMAGGFHINLFNNVWGTNYAMWTDDDMRFRFTLRFPPTE